RRIRIRNPYDDIHSEPRAILRSVHALPRVGQTTFLPSSTARAANATVDGQPVLVTFGPGEIARAFRQVTPTLLVVGMFTGFAFAIGGAIAEGYVSSPIPGHR